MRKWIFICLSLLVLVGAVVPNKTVVAVDFISSNCGVLIEQTTGRVLFEKCAHESMYIASITKILTAILAIENGEMDEWVQITDEDVHQVGSSLYMVAGDSMQLGDLVYGLMLRSGNDAAWAIARHIGGDVDTFVQMMNEKVQALGLVNSVFQNPSGLDETTYNLSTAYDMGMIQRYAMNNPIFREISYTSMHRATSEAGRTFMWKNKHRLVNGRYAHAVSGKTGFTKQAKRTLVTSANNGDLELVAVTLVGGNDWNDHIAMFEYGFNHFNMRQVTDIGELHFLETTLLEHAGFERLFVRESRSVLLRVDEEVRKHLVIHEDVAEGAAVGVLEILVADEIALVVPVYVFEELVAPTWWQRIVDWIIGV